MAGIQLDGATWSNTLAFDVIVGHFEGIVLRWSASFVGSRMPQ